MAWFWGRTDEKMSLKKTGQVKKDKGFKLFDLIIYGALVLLVTALFLGIFLTRDTSPLTGVRILYGNQTVYEYSFEDGETVCADCVEKREESGGITLKITAEGGFNTVYIDKAAHTVKVTESDCSSHRDCVYFPAIADNSSFISCVPHKLTIEPLGYDYDNGTIIM